MCKLLLFYIYLYENKSPYIVSNHRLLGYRSMVSTHSLLHSLLSARSSTLSAWVRICGPSGD